jgi:hypothetical protein
MSAATDDHPASATGRSSDDRLNRPLLRAPREPKEPVPDGARPCSFIRRRYCLALARLIDSDGSRVFEQTRALDVEDGSGSRRQAAGGGGRTDWTGWSAPR